MKPPNELRVGYVSFGDASELPIGLHIVVDAIVDRWPDIEPPRRVDPGTAKAFDVVLVTLYWWEDVYSYVRWLDTEGIDPKRGQPFIVVGGMAAMNPLVLAPWCSALVVGDGECSICEILENLPEAHSVPGVWTEASGADYREAQHLPAKVFVNQRTNKIAQIELTRGCKMHCPFCELTHLKTYREQPLEILRHLLHQAPTKIVNFTSADFWSHSQAEQVQALVKRAGKVNSGSDVRLDLVDRIGPVNRVQFGVEAFGERVRRKIGKVGTDDQLVAKLTKLIVDTKTPKGTPLSSATCYMIADLPGETREDVASFWDCLRRVDEAIDRRFTLFLSVSSFAPSPFTPMAGDGINPYSEFGRWFSETRQTYKNIIIATRGACRAAPQRLAQMLTIRGTESARRAIKWLALHGWGLIHSTNPKDGKIVESVCEKAGFNHKTLYEQQPTMWEPPWASIKMEDIHARTAA